MNQKKPGFQKLVDRARREQAPPVDVAQRVAERIADAPPVTPAIDWPLLNAAAASALAAAAVLLISFRFGVVMDDPLVDWLRPLVTIM